MKIYELVKNILEDYKVNFKVESLCSDQIRPNAKLLIFGNNDVAALHHKGMQPFFIADEFEAIRL
ncbi:hypothetical protein [Chondrinema litorale]|uniref:hypothetical protein n=1 Tax=Chondrinema litorale TaxID=2994555 RepID=UPI002543554D|nr:hypothetical protein [Chondrinema litorale]UZR99733.1 hypothetical protein OQ292_38225 [Chondrinema litorale]